MQFDITLQKIKHLLVDNLKETLKVFVKDNAAVCDTRTKLAVAHLKQLVDNINYETEQPLTTEDSNFLFFTELHIIKYPYNELSVYVENITGDYSSCNANGRSMPWSLPWNQDIPFSYKSVLERAKKDKIFESKDLADVLNKVRQELKKGILDVELTNSEIESALQIMRYTLVTFARESKFYNIDDIIKTVSLGSPVRATKLILTDYNEYPSYNTQHASIRISFEITVHTDLSKAKNATRDDEDDINNW
jgi:hypothetical protein